MQTRTLSVVFWVLFSVWGHGQVASSGADETPTKLEPGTLVESGPNERVWTSGDADSDRKVVEIGTGMNCWDGQNWAPSDPSIDVTADAFGANRLQFNFR